MAKVKPTIRNCKLCACAFPFVPYRILCMSCYKKDRGFESKEIQFINDD